MPRTIWNGVISFGMVSIPIGLYPATSEKDISFNQLHSVCGTRIKQQKFCPHCERTVEATEIDRGFEYTKGKYVIVTDKDLEELPVPTRHTIEILAFVKSDQVDPVYFDAAYYIEPEEVGKKPYALLIRALQGKNVSALAKVAFRNKEHLCLLRATDKSIVMETLYYPEEIRTPVEVSVTDVGEKELAMAEMLVEALEEDFDPSRYQDQYRETLMKSITAKVEGEEIQVAPTVVPKAQVIDLMDALRASVEAAKESKKSG